MSNKMPDVLDKRLVDRFVQRGLLKRDDVNTVLNKLPDLEGQADDIAGLVFGDGSEEAAEVVTAPEAAAEGTVDAPYREATIVPVDSPEVPPASTES